MGAMTLNITTLRIMAINIIKDWTLNMKTLAFMTLGITKLSNLCHYAEWHCAEYHNGTAHIRHQCRKTNVLSCRRCLIKTGVEKMNYI